MKFLGLDIGSSSLKAGVVSNGRVIGKPIRAGFATRFSRDRAEVPAEGILKAIAQAVGELGDAAKKVDAIGLSVMSPAWVAMDARGKALTPIVTHQDRRSVQMAHEIESRVGKARILQITGNRPFPGGISSTTLAWFLKYESALMRRADLVGHLNTFLHRQMTESRAIDPSNASFTGLYETVKQGSWSTVMCEAIGISESKLPEIIAGNAIAGCVTTSAGGRFGLTPGTPMLTGVIDTSSAMLLTGAKAGQLLNVSGSTDVLGLCTAKAHPHEQLLTRALGVGKKWMSVSSLAAAGSAIVWMREQFFRDLSQVDFYEKLTALAKAGKRRQGKKMPPDHGVIFDPYLAGERTSIDQKTAGFTGLTLSTTREQMLDAVIESLARASGARIALFGETGARIGSHVIISGGGAKNLRSVLYRDWPGHWRFTQEEEASLRGVGNAGIVER